MFLPVQHHFTQSARIDLIKKSGPKPMTKGHLISELRFGVLNFP